MIQMTPIMFLRKLPSLSRNGFYLSQRLPWRTTKRNISTSESRTIQSDKSIKYQMENNVDNPIPFSKTKASTHLARHTRVPDSDKPQFQSLVISISLSIFMIYFFILREENDIDELFEKSLPGLMSEAKAAKTNSNKKT